MTLVVPLKCRSTARTLSLTKRACRSTCGQLVLAYHERWLERGDLVLTFMLERDLCS